MTDRQIVYAGALPQTTDLLDVSKFAMLGDAFTAMATLGNSASAPSTIIAGLACTPTGPASLQVNVGPGAIFSLDATDATGYGDLGTDSTQIYKMGIRSTTGTLTITPPGTSGFSQVFLVQAILSDIDAGSTVLSYYNAANPSVPLSGPANAGTSQNTTRTCVCTVALKAGVAATTGTQTNPAPDTGYTALYYITVANGATQITSGNIVQANGGYEPFVNTALPYIPRVSQSGIWTYGGLTTNSGNAYSAALTPAPTSLTVGMVITLKMNTLPLGASTLNVNSLGAQSMVRRGGIAISHNDWNANDFISWEWTGSSWMACSFLQGDIPGGTPLQANADWYVDSSIGNDTLYDGTSATVSGSHGPWQTLQRAANQVPIYNLNGFSITIHVANGSYSGVTLQKVNGSGGVTFLGNVTTMSSCLITGSSQSAIIAKNVNGTYTFHGFKVTASGTNTTDPVAGANASGASTVLVLGNIEFGACVGAHFAISQGATGSSFPNCVWNITGGCTGNTITDGAFLSCYGSALFQVATGAPPAISVQNAVTYAGSFVESNFSSFIQLVYASLTNPSNVTGKRYNATGNGVISTSGGGSTYYPGTIAGTTSTGGQYI